jgi:glutamyl-tRNA reductase
MKIIEKNADFFLEWFNARDLGPLIGQMKEKFAQISQNELERFLSRTSQDDPYRKLTKAMVNRIVNKLLHCVIKKVNVIAKEQGSSEAAKLVDSIVRQAEEISSEPPDKENTQS